MKFESRKTDLPQKNFDSLEKERREELQAVKKFLDLYNLPDDKIPRAWKRNARPFQWGNGKEKMIYTPQQAQKDLRAIVEKNFLCIQKIETVHPGACRFLYDNYGIRNFGRFSPETWIAQYEEKEKSGPYGLVVIAEDDWNASTYNENALKAYEDLRKKIYPSHSLRIIEAQNLPDLARLLSRVKKKFGEPPPAFVVWSGHGGQEFFLGPARYRKRNYKFSIAKEDFEGAAAERIKPYLDFFSRDTVMILDACSKDEENNLPTTASRAMGNEFIYPDGETSVKDFGVKIDDNGKISFNVEYNFGVTSVTNSGPRIDNF